MRPLDAVSAGYDELTHLNFVVMQAMPQEIVDKANTARADRRARRDSARTSTGRRPKMRAFIAELKQRGTIVDPTLVIFEGALTWTAARRRRPMHRTWGSSRRCSTATSSRAAIRW